MTKRENIFAIVAVILGLIASLLMIWGSVLVYISWAKASGRGVTPAISNSRIAQRIFVENSYRRLMKAVEAEMGGKFSTSWDFNQGIALSRSIFVPTEMFGLTKYKYLPDIGIYNCRIWSGLHFSKFAVRKTLAIAALLEQSEADCIHFETDNNGFKNMELPAEPRPSTVFFLGDSFTEGLFVAPADTFVSRFGRKLRSGGVSATVMNLGIDGYSALEMYWMLEQYGPVLEPKVVIVNLFPNDVHADYNRVVSGKDIPQQNYQQMFDYLGRIQDFCKKYDVELIVVVIPTKSQFAALQNFSVFQDRVEAWSKARAITFLDPRAYFDRVGAERIYFSWDPHFSIEGHEHYAAFLYQRTASIIRRAVTQGSAFDQHPAIHRATH